MEQQIYLRAEEDRLRTLRIEEAVKNKLEFVPFLSRSHYKTIIKEEHFPHEHLDRKKQLKGKIGYSRPKNMVKYAV